MEPIPVGPARIADVAARAGVGVATVSRVLNGRASVSPATRARVLEAIDHLNYRPSSVARNLSLKRTLVIGVVVPFFTSPSAVERIRGIVTALEGSPYDLALFDVESADRQRRAFDLLGRGDRADGLLIVSLVPPEEELSRLKLPTVLVDAPHPWLPNVIVDDVAGAELATRHLLELGHRKIAFVGDKPGDPFRFRSGRDRTIGYEQALVRAGIALRDEYIRVGTPSRHVARSIAEELFRLADPPTAVFAGSDVQALGVLEAARALGLRVPGDLSVVGFDDLDFACVLAPPLTTVAADAEGLGAAAFEALALKLAGVDVAAEQVLPVALRVRDSTGPPRE